MASTDARPVPIKNTAFRVTFPILDNDGDPVTGAAGLDSEVSKDGAAFADCTNEATEISAGIYYLDLTSTEMNADCVAVMVKTSTLDAKTTVLIFYPQEAGDVKVDVETIKTQAVTCAAGVTVLASVGTAATSTAQTGDSFARLGAPAGASTAVDIAAIKTQTAAIEADTQDLQTQVGTDGAGLTAIGDTRIANLDAAVSTRASQASVDDLPTNAELATALGTADDAVLTQIALVKAATDTIADLPTNAELATALGTADDAVLAQVALVKAKTDNLPSDPADQSLIVAATDALATLIGDVPTNAELATALASADDAVLTQIALVKAATDTIADLPTNAELATALGTADDAVLAQVALVKAKTDNLPSDPADQSLVIAAADAIYARLGAPAGASIAADIAAIEGGGGGGGLTAQEVRDAMKLAASAGDPAAGSVDAKLNALAAGAGSGAYTITVTVTDGTDPLQNATVRVTEGASTFTAVTDADGEAQFALDAGTFAVAVTKGGYSFTPTTRTVTGDEAGTLATADLELALVVIPSPAGDSGVCHVYGYLETPGNVVAAGVQITFELVAPTLTGSERLISGRKVIATTDEDGAIASDAGAYVALQRNDLLEPAGSYWEVTCAALKLKGERLELTGETFDLASLI